MSAYRAIEVTDVDARPCQRWNDRLVVEPVGPHTKRACAACAAATLGDAEAEVASLRSQLDSLASQNEVMRGALEKAVKFDDAPRKTVLGQSVLAKCEAALAAPVVASVWLLRAGRAVADFWIADEGGAVEDTDLSTNLVRARRAEREGGK